MDRPQKGAKPSRIGSAGLSRRRFLAAGAALATAGRVGGAAAAETLRFGLTPVFLTSDLELLESLRTYLAKQLSRPIELVQRRTYQEITALLLSEQLTAAWICGFPYVQYREHLRLLAVPVWRGRPLYQSYLIVPRDRDAKDVTDRWPYPFIEINPEDMADLGLKEGDLVEVFNDSGATQAMAYPTPTAKRNETFMLFAYPTGV